MKAKAQKLAASARAAVRRKAATFRARAMVYNASRPHRSLRRTAKRDQKRMGGQPLVKLLPFVRSCFGFMWRERWPLFKLGGLYVVISYVVVGGLSQVDFVALKDASQQIFTGGSDALINATSLFLGTASGTLNSTATELQQFLAGLLAFIAWLATVWLVRMRLADQQVKVRDALYNCCAPFVPAAIVVLIIFAQLLPAAVGLFAFTVAQVDGTLVGGVETMLFAFAAGLLTLLSLYWISGSVLAMVTATMPGMYPWRALSVSSRLVIGQRWKLGVRVVTLAAIILLVWAVVLLPALYLDAWLHLDWLPLVPLVVQFLGAFSLLFGAVYCYKLYRSLL